MRIALAGGGSGGHLFPGLALARALLGAGRRPILYGSGRVGERSWIGENAIPIALPAPLLPARRREMPAFLARLARAVEMSLREMRRRRPDLVVGLGGYASVAPGVAALITHRPLLLLEQNVVPGKANRLLARLGGRVAATYGDSLRHLSPPARKRARVVGNPVRGELREGLREPERFGLSRDRPVLLVTGGSQGACGLNTRVSACAEVLARRGIQVLHLAGQRGVDSVREAYGRAGVSAWVEVFSHEMGTLYRTADLVLCRAGGTTLAELTSLSRPSVLVPYPYHGDRHQERNARVLEAAGAALVVAEEELSPERFEAEVAGLIRDGEALERMGRAARSLAVPDAAERTARWAREIVGAGRIAGGEAERR